MRTHTYTHTDLYIKICKIILTFVLYFENVGRYLDDDVVTCNEYA